MINLNRRLILSQILSTLDNSDIILLLGARQVGKTSILRLLSDHIRAGQPNCKILALDAEDIIIRQTLNALNLASIPAWLASNSISLDNRSYLIIDEIQYLDQPASLLKILHDHFPSIKCLASGSSTLEIKNKLQDSLMGRKQIFHIDTLTFAEHLDFQEQTYPQLIQLSLPQIIVEWQKFSPIIQEAHDKMFSLWQNFVVTGGYPKISLSTNWDEAAKNLLELRTTFISRDIPEYYRYLDGRALSNLIMLLAEQTGNLLNEAEVSNTIKISKTTIARYLWLLEQTFAVFRLTPFFSNKRSELSKMPKIYFHDTGWRNIWLQPTLTALAQRTDAGHLVENGSIIGVHKKIILNKLDNFYNLHFWRTTGQQEVDLILAPTEYGKAAIPMEIKYQSQAKPVIPAGIKSFLNKYPASDTAIVITKETVAQENWNGKKIFFVPAWVVC